MLNGLQRALLTTTFRSLSQLHSLAGATTALAAMPHSQLSQCAGAHQLLIAHQMRGRSHHVSAHAAHAMPAAPPAALQPRQSALPGLGQHHSLRRALAVAAASSWRAYQQHPGRSAQSSALQAAAAAGDVPASYTDMFDFDDSWINRVGITGKVLKGPKLNHYYVRDKYKAVMVLGLFSQNTGDPFVDMPRTVLVEAWGPQAKALHQEVQTGSIIYLSGHLAYDYRRKNRFPGPMLALRADAWNMIDEATVPPDRRLPEYEGEFDLAFEDYKSTTASPAADTDGQGTGRGRRQATSSGIANWKPQALQMFQEGRPVSELAAHFNYKDSSVAYGLIEAALAEGYQSSSWPRLLEYLGLAGPNALDPAAVFDAVSFAINNNTAPLTKEGTVRLSAIREYLLSDACSLSGALKQREERAAGDPSPTYGIIRFIIALREKGGNPSMLQV